MRGIPDDAPQFVAAWEGLRLRSYEDVGGVWTIGYGHTGPGVHAGQEITKAQAMAFLEDDLRIAASRLATVVKREVIFDLTDNQYTALLSFVFNLGAPAKATLWKVLNARQFDQVPAQLARWVYVGKTKVKGLVNRRAAESVLWSTAEPGSVEVDLPSSYTRAEATPAAHANPVPLVKQPAFLVTVAGLLIGAPGLITQAVEALTPLTPAYPAAAQIVEWLTHIAPIAGAVATFVLWLQQKQASR